MRFSLQLLFGCVLVFLVVFLDACKVKNSSNPQRVEYECSKTCTIDMTRRSDDFSYSVKLAQNAASCDVIVQATTELWMSLASVPATSDCDTNRIVINNETLCVNALAGTFLVVYASPSIPSSYFTSTAQHTIRMTTSPENSGDWKLELFVKHQFHIAQKETNIKYSSTGGKTCIVTEYSARGDRSVYILRQFDAVIPPGKRPQIKCSGNFFRVHSSGINNRPCHTYLGIGNSTFCDAEAFAERTFPASKAPTTISLSRLLYLAENELVSVLSCIATSDPSVQCTMPPSLVSREDADERPPKTNSNASETVEVREPLTSLPRAHVVAVPEFTMSESSIKVTATEEPTIGSLIKATVTEEPSSESHIKATATEEPTSESHIKTTATEKPTSGLPIQATATEEPTSGSHIKLTATEEPTSESPIKATANEEPTSESPIVVTASQLSTSESSMRLKPADALEVALLARAEKKKLPKLEYYALFQPSQPGPYDSYLTKLRVYENRIIPNLPNVLKGNMTVANLTKFKDIESVTVTDKVQEFGQELKAKLMPITYLISKLQTQGILPEVASDPGAEQRVKKHLTCLENIRSKIEDFTKNNLDPGSQLSPQQLKVLKSLAASVDNCSSNAQDLRDYLQKSSHGSYILDNIPSVDESIFATLEVHRLLAQLLASLNQ